jgi:hypothetical protein
MISQAIKYKQPTLSRTPRKLFISKYTHSILDKINIQSIFQETALLPPHLTSLPPPLICLQLPKSLGRHISNYSSLRKLTFDDIVKLAESPCNCSSHPISTFADPHAHHIFTAQSSFISSPALRAIFSLGTAFRWNPSLSTSSALVLASLLTSLKTYVYTLADDLNISFDSLKPWFLLLSNTLTTLFESHALPDQLQADPRFATPLTPVVLSALKTLSSQHIITYVDKASHAFAFVCKPYYCQRILAELTTGNTYSVNQLSSTDIINGHHAFMAKYGIPFDPDIHCNLSLLYMVVKAHKDPVNGRFISSSHLASLEPLSRFLSQALKALSPIANELWQGKLKPAYPHSSPPNCWILNNSADLIQPLQSLNADIKSGHIDCSPHSKHLETFDFSTLYTKIDLPELCTRMSTLVTDLFAFHKTNSRHTHLIVSLSKGCKATWATGKPNHVPEGSVCFDETSLSECLEYLINNTVVTAGDRFFNQIIGIPMGTNCAVFIANLFLFTYELEYMVKLIDTRQYDLIRSFQYTFRYIDDIISMHNPHFDLERNKIYPVDMLALNPEQSGRSVSFLDLRIYKTSCNSRSPYSTTIFDKRCDPKYAALDKRKYPHINSFMPLKIKYNVMISQCWSYSRRCLTKRSFVFNVSKLSAELLFKGYSHARIFRNIRSFLKRALPLYNCFHPRQLIKKITARVALFMKQGIAFIDIHAP